MRRVTQRSNYRINWDDQPLGEITDAALAEQIGVTPQAVYSARKARGIKPFDTRINWDDQPLGVGPDLDLARNLGVDVSSVQKARSRRGISDGGIRGYDWHSLPWGQYTNGELAKMTERHHATVRAARIRLGVSEFKLNRVCPCGQTFETGCRWQRFCSERCEKCVSRARQKHGGGQQMSQIYAHMAKMRRIVSEKTGRKFKW